MRSDALHILYNSGLTAKESAVVRARIGLNYPSGLTLAQIGKLMGGVSRQSIFVHLEIATDKMKLFAVSEGLVDATASTSAY